MTAKQQKKSLSKEEQEMKEAADSITESPGICMPPETPPWGGDEPTPLARQIQPAGRSRRALAISGSVDVVGLEDIPKSDLRLPIIKLVQGTTSKTKLADGSDASPGEFMHTADLTASKEINFVILRAKKITTQFEDQPPQPNYIMLGVLDGHFDETGLFSMRIPLTSMSSFKEIITQIYRQREKYPEVWSHKVKAWAESQTRSTGQGKYWRMRMQVEGQYKEDELEQLTDLFNDYAGALDQNGSEPDDERL